MRRLFAALALLVAFLAVPASAEERILGFDSQVTVNRDGSLDITETIRANAENVKINRGIFRDFPTKYDGRRGERINVGFELVSVERDGQSERSNVESLSNGVRVRVGNPDVIIPVGEHTYRIRYRTNRQLGYFDGFDELYWNVTGSGWDFPIDQASASITLPSPANFGDRAYYTGRQGGTGTTARVAEERPGYIRFETTAPLSPREGLTVAAAFPKGVVDAPSTATKARNFLADWAPPLVAAGGLLGLIAFLFHAWRRVGRDPPAGTVVPLFNPPADLSPAAMRYVVNQGIDNRAFAAAIVDAAVKGHVRIVEEDSGIFSSTKRYIERLRPGPDARPLEAAEETAINHLASPGERIEMDNENHVAFSNSIKNLKSILDKRFEDKAFKRNTLWAVAAFGLALGVLWITAGAIIVSEGLPEAKIALASLLMFGLAAVCWALIPKRDGLIGWILKAIPFILVGIGAVIAFPMIFIALEAGRWLPIGIAALGIPIGLATFFWISAPTPEGRTTLDQIAGFKQYLSITEREKLNRMHAPEDNIEVFERFLPYAIALGVENRWADRFEDVLKAAMVAGGTGTAFGWYSGSHSPWNDIGGFTDSVGDTLSNSVSSASTAPGSSSGSGGGGFSGGGGGGGGGGGW